MDTRRDDIQLSSSPKFKMASSYRSRRMCCILKTNLTRKFAADLSLQIFLIHDISAKLQNTPQLISASLTCVGRLWRSRHNTIDAILIQWHVNELRGILKLLRYLLVRLWWNILVANLATNFQDLVAKGKNLVAISRPANSCWLASMSRKLSNCCKLLKMLAVSLTASKLYRIVCNNNILL